MKSNHNWCIFIQQNAFENVVGKMVANLSRPQCVKSGRPLHASLIMGTPSLGIAYTRVPRFVITLSKDALG